MSDIIRGYRQLKDENISMALTVLLGWTNLFTYQVPARAKLLMTHFSNYMGTADWGNVEWRVCVNGIPTYPLESVLDQLGISTRPRLSQPIKIDGGDVLTIDATLLAGAVADPNDVGIAVRFEVE